MKKFSHLRFLLTITAGLCLTIVAAAQPQNNLVLIRRNNLYGYADRTGKVVIAPRYDQAQQFSEGLAAVKIKDKWGYIDEADKSIIAPQYESADRFSEGLAPVELNQKFGYINPQGKFVIPARYDRAKPFSEGLAVVRDGNEWLVVNVSGVVAFKTEYDIVDSFSEGLAAVKTQGRWGYIDRNGKLAIQLQFASAGSFSNGLAPARLNPNSAVGFINPSGSFSIAPRFREAKGFANGLAAVQTDKSWGFIDVSGELKIQPRYAEAGSFLRSPGKGIDGELAQVTDQVYGRTLYIDSAGQVAFEMSDGRETGVGGYRLVPLEINSNPAGARVFLVPRDDWDHDPDLIKKDLNQYRIKESDTAPVTTQVYEQVLICVYDFNGKRGWKLVDVRGPGKNSVGITPQ